MRQTIIAIATLFILTLTMLVMPSPSLASGTTTTSNQAGQVVIRDENGVVYLTTTTNGDTIYSRNLNLLGTPIQLPKGFAANVAVVINSVLNLVMLVAALLVLLYLVWGAFDWLTSGGDKGKIDGARQKITAAIVGLIILSASYAVTILVVRFLGFKDLNDVFENVQSLDGQRQVFSVIGTSTSTTSATPRPSASPVYSDNLGDVMRR